MISTVHDQYEMLARIHDAQSGMTQAFDALVRIHDAVGLSEPEVIELSSVAEGALAIAYSKIERARQYVIGIDMTLRRPE